jgi:hypothetical protein
MSRNRTYALPVAIVAALLMVMVAGCANRKEPATKAVADAEAALATFRDEAGQFAASELQEAETAIADMKARLAQGDYDAVVEAAPALSTRIETLRRTTADRRAEREQANEAARATWATMAEDLPKMVQAIRDRVDALSKSRRLPGNLDKARFDAARADFEQMKSTWNEATAAASSGDAVEAVSRGEAAKARGTDVMRALGMNVGAAG